MNKLKKSILETDSSGTFKLMAVSTSLTLNKLLWSIKTQCNVSLKRNEELETRLKSPAFTDRENEIGAIISLVANKNNQGTLFKKISNVDFLIEVNGLDNLSMVSNFFSCLKKIQGVTAAIPLDPKSLKILEPLCPE
ncbi:MAG: hypothetical protein H6537_04075 [Bacteroidales bacterium]|nr:hypothetical protein [Bacteroidales bacterium]HPD96621.1 hypothetical protein [Tenuifilaceae bacterium]HRX30292.1 hypothetical protein [Tenuifilaceae bacterium]